MKAPTTRTIPFVEPWLDEAWGEAVRDQVNSGFLGPGRCTTEFTEALAAYAGSAHCLLTTSGTVALSVAAHAVGLEPGDEIIVPAYGVISTINAFASIHLRPRLADIDRGTGCISQATLAEAITPSTKAVCYVNFSGATGPELVEIASFCKRKGLPLIEDAACAMGHQHLGKLAGTFGTVGIYSFSVPKLLTTGQGGAVVSDDRATFERAAAFIDHGDLEWRKTNLNRGVGTNLRFNDILSRLGLCQLEDIEERLARRREVHGVLKKRLGKHLHKVPGDEAPMYNIVFSPEPDRMVDFLRARGIGALRQYRTISQHPAFADLAGIEYANADFWTDHCVFLPSGMALTGEDAEIIAEGVLAFDSVLPHP